MKVTTSTALQRRRFELVKQEIPVLTVAKDLMPAVAGVFKQHGHEWRGTCPSCTHGTHSGAFGVDPEKNVWNCFACGEGGDVIELAYLSGFASRNEAVAWLGFTYGVELPERPESWYRKQDRQARIREQMDEVRRNVLRRRLFKYLILPILEEIEDPKEREQETKAAWAEMRKLPLHVRQGGGSGG